MKFSIKDFFNKCDQIRSFSSFFAVRRFLVQTPLINQPVLGTQLDMWFSSILGSQLNNGYLALDERGRSSVIARPLGSQIIGKERKLNLSRYQV